MAGREIARARGCLFAGRCWRSAHRFSGMVPLVAIATATASGAQDTAIPRRATSAPASDSAELSIAGGRIEVRPQARDDEISARLQSVLDATDWFESSRVRVQSGVVFLTGTASSERVKAWAGDLSRNTQGVVAVANRMNVRRPSMWDFGPASRGMVALWRDAIGLLPSMAFGVVVLGISALFAWVLARALRRTLRDRVRVRLLRSVIARAAGALVLLIGVYVILRVMGLTQLALTVVGGTGLIGLAVGIAFRDITENFLASVLLSVQRPFEPADLIDVNGTTGYVQQINMRTTVLMNLDGNVVQIPNATVYKSSLRNYSTNSNRREFFDIGVGYDTPIAIAQDAARGVLLAHPAVLEEPQPSVLVDRLGASTVQLRVYFWLDGRANSWLKVRSSVIRLLVREFQRRGISMPDPSREVIFPRGVPIVSPDAADRALGGTGEGRAAQGSAQPNSEAPAVEAEGGLHSEAATIEAQARQSRRPSDDDNLLIPDRNRDNRAAGRSNA